MIFIPKRHFLQQKMLVAQARGSTFPGLVQTPSICLPSFYLNILYSSKIMQALHRSRDRYKFTPNVQRQDKWVTPEGLLCLLGAGHPPSALWLDPPSRPHPHWFSLTLDNHFSFLTLGRGKGWHWVEDKLRCDMPINQRPVPTQKPAGVSC